MEKVKLVRMHLDGQPDSDVHPLEVENWKGHGWEVVESLEEKPKKPAKSKETK